MAQEKRIKLNHSSFGSGATFTVPDGEIWYVDLMVGAGSNFDETSGADQNVIHRFQKKVAVGNTTMWPTEASVSYTLSYSTSGQDWAVTGNVGVYLWPGTYKCYFDKDGGSANFGDGCFTEILARRIL